jgi:signal transduction histidine kinase
MKTNHFEKVEGGRVSISIVFFILIAIVSFWIYKAVVITNINSNPKNSIDERSENIKDGVLKIFNSEQTKLIDKADDVKQNLRDTLKSGNVSYGSLVQLVNEKKYQKYSLEIVAPNGRLIAWNDQIAIPQEDLFPLLFPPGESFFYNSPLVTYLSYADTLNVQNDIFYFFLSQPFEKRYNIQNSFYKKTSFINDISNKYNTYFNIDYDQFTPGNSKELNYSFEIRNNKNKEIASATFEKTSVKILTESINKEYDSYISFLFFLLILVLLFGVKKEFNKIKSRLIRLLIIIIFCTAFRYVLFILNFPSDLLNGPLTDPAYFSSSFAWGIVRTPIEFFVTNIFLVFIAVTFFNYISGYIKSKSSVKTSKKINYLFAIFFLIIFFLTLRGLASSVRSIIFDSTLRYFKEPNLIPNLPAFWMNINLLLIGLSSILVMAGSLTYFFQFVYSEDKKVFIKRFFMLFLFYEVAGLIFIFLQNEALVTPLLSIVFVLVIFIVTFFTGYIHPKKINNFIYAALAASIITVALLNYFNLDLEKESLRTTAYEINRPNENLFKFIINETLLNSYKDKNIEEALSNSNENYYALAFKIWSKSSLQKESLKSAIFLLDSTGNLLGGFSVGIRPSRQIINLAKAEKDRPEILEFSDSTQPREKMFSGVIPVTANNKLIGYISAVINFTRTDFNVENIPDFLKPMSNFFNTVINIDQLKVFEFVDNKLNYVYGNVYPSRDEAAKILKADYSPNNDVWVNIQLSGENYITYALKNNEDNNKIVTVVSLRKKDLSWNIFNFFKVFIIHITLILLLVLIIFLVRFKNFNYTFRLQLLISFLLVSIIPLLVLALYNQYIVEKRTQSSIFEELNERADYITQQVDNQLERNNVSLDDAFYNTSREMGIAFSVYDGSNRVFSSKGEYYRNGLFQSKLNSQAYYNLFYQTYREYLTKEKIENFKYDAFYTMVSFKNKEYVIGVNDAFNKVQLTFSAIDIDVFLFGIYSFATLIIIIVSTFLSNRISSPIRKLTKATTSVAHGDLNIDLSSSQEKGEIKELIEGFNYMTTELKKNQIEITELERESAWKEMAKQVAHEIKNPLTPMKLAVQQLVSLFKEKNPNFELIFEKLSATILNQIENLSLIASEFSRFAKMPSIKLEEMDLVEIIKDVINLYSEESVKIEFKTNIRSAKIESDKTQLRRAFVNLIRNSIQAKASIILINLNEINGNFRIVFEDNGEGIHVEVKEKIFEGSFTTKKHGMGIGLKLTKRFLEGIGGEITLLNSVQHKTTFIIIIPKNSEIDKALQ